MILGIGKTTTQQAKTIHSGEAYELWQHLVMRYDVQELATIYQNFINDVEFKSLMTWGLSVIEKEITKMEDEMDKLGIPLPKRPPQSINTPANSEIFRDETMFRSIYMMTQIFLSQLQRTRVILVDPKLRDMFMEIQKSEEAISQKMVTYGRLKGWLHFPPRYKG